MINTCPVFINGKYATNNLKQILLLTKEFLNMVKGRDSIGGEIDCKSIGNQLVSI